MNIRLTSLFLFLLLAVSTSAQDAEEIDVLYSHQLNGGINLHTHGGGIFANFSKFQDASHLTSFGLEVVFLKHEKEIRSFNPVYEDSKSYVVGKANSFFVVRPSIGREKILTKKLRKSGVQVGYSYSFGPALGFTKPIYLEIGYPSIPYDYLVVEQYNPEEHFSNNIFGRASGLKGFDKLKFHPGGFAKFAMNFEYSNEKSRLKGIEVGAVLDVFLNDIPIMAEQLTENNQFFLNGFVNIYIGKRYILR